MRLLHVLIYNLFSVSYVWSGTKRLDVKLFPLVIFQSPSHIKAVKWNFLLYSGGSNSDYVWILNSQKLLCLMVLILNGIPKPNSPTIPNLTK